MKKKKIKIDDNLEGGMVYSTNKNFAFEGLTALLKADESSQVDTKAQILEVHLEKKGRGGKTAVIVRGFQGSESALENLCKKLKIGIGVGGSTKDGEIIIQGDRRDKVMEILQKEGFKTKRVGG